MRTVIPKSITKRSEAKLFLFSLFMNGEAYHPEDNAHDVVWESEVSEEEKELLNIAMDQVWKIPDFDPCEYLLRFINNREYRPEKNTYCL